MQARTGTGNSVIEHRQRKNPRSAELWKERKRGINAERGKQVWVNGRWERV